MVTKNQQWKHEVIIEKRGLLTDARIIAAAPDLLAALREMLHQFADHEQYDEDGHDTAAINKARAAIAKATGEQLSSL